MFADVLEAFFFATDSLLESLFMLSGNSWEHLGGTLPFQLIPSLIVCLFFVGKFFFATDSLLDCFVCHSSAFLFFSAVF